MHVVTALASAALALLVQAAYASEVAWQALRAGGTVALMRHSRAPGVGDPPDFRLNDCATQRNLSTEGREEARRIGEQFRRRQVHVERVLSSRWCRALETARLAFGDRVEAYPALDSFFAGRDRQDDQTRALRSLVEKWQGSGTLVLITHQVNITALTGVFPSESEILVLKPETNGGFGIVDRIRN